MKIKKIVLVDKMIHQPCWKCYIPIYHLFHEGSLRSKGFEGMFSNENGLIYINPKQVKIINKCRKDEQNEGGRK